MDRIEKIKGIAKAFIRGDASVEFENDYYFVSQLINRKSGNKFEIRLLKKLGTMEFEDLKVMFDFCYELKGAYQLDFSMTFSNNSGSTVIIAKLDLGNERNTDQLDFSKVGEAVEDLVNTTQEIVDNPDNGIEKVTMQINDNDEVTIAEQVSEVPVTPEVAPEPVAEPQAQVLAKKVNQVEKGKFLVVIGEVVNRPKLKLENGYIDLQDEKLVEDNNDGDVLEITKEQVLEALSSIEGCSEAWLDEWVAKRIDL